MLLQLHQVRKSYGAVQVIRGLDLDVLEGEFVGVIGPNGAGKTTAFGLVAGSLACDSGEVRLDGANVSALDAAARCKAGIGRTFQIPQPFAGMTVYENALVASTFGAGLRGKAASLMARDVLERCALVHRADGQAGTLSLLDRKRLELARALATRPRLLLLDEVGGGLTDGEVSQLLDLVTSIHQSGVTVLWIEHIVHALVSVVKRLVVLSDGALLADGLPHEVLASSAVRQTYLGDKFSIGSEDVLSQEVERAAH
ncbi:MAG: ATP-binding cassette domain-containing protein [Variovorax sp.]